MHRVSRPSSFESLIAIAAAVAQLKRIAYFIVPPESQMIAAMDVMRRRFVYRTSFRLQTKLQLSFLLVGFISIMVTGWQAFNNARGAIEKITFDRLTSIRETKKRQIESYFRQVCNEVVSLSADPTVVDASKGFVAAFE